MTEQTKNKLKEITFDLVRMHAETRSIEFAIYCAKFYIYDNINENWISKEGNFSSEEVYNKFLGLDNNKPEECATK